MVTDKCIICKQRPSRTMGRCAICNDRLNIEHKRKNGDKPRYFLTYQGIVVGLYKNGDGKLNPRLLKRSDKYLPKGITLDLNHYCNGYSRELIKKFKATCLQLAYA